MIIKGKSITGPEALGPYLQNAEVNECISVLEIKGTVSQDLIGALIEMDAYAAGTRCKNPLYHGKISPEPPYRLTLEQVMESVDAMEEKLGLTGHARVVVMHEKLGRQHFHPVWARIDLQTMRAIPDSHNYRKHEEVSRDLERRFGHPRVQGAHAERDGVERPDRSPTRSELAQEQRTGVSRKSVKQAVTGCFRASDSADAFRAVVEDNGYLIAKGDRRDFVVVDRAGGIHSLAKMIEGMRAAELREFMKPIRMESLPSAQLASEAQIDRANGRTSRLDQAAWDDALRKSAVEKDRQGQIAEDAAGKRFREESIKWEAAIRAAEKAAAEQFRAEAIKWEAGQKELRLLRMEARREAKREKNFSRGDDYVTQSGQALRDHLRRQRKLDKLPRPQHPDDYRARSIESKFTEEGKEVTRLKAEKPGAPEIPMTERSRSPATDRLHRNKVADKIYTAMDKLLYGERHEQSYLREQATRQSEEERSQKLEKSKTHGSFDKPVGSMQTARAVWESDEAGKKRLQRLLNEEKWIPRLDSDDLEPDRQQKAPGGGRTRGR